MVAVVAMIMSYHISYRIVVLKWQNRLKVGTEKPKLKVKMQSASDSDVRKRLLEKPRCEHDDDDDDDDDENNNSEDYDDDDDDNHDDDYVPVRMW